MTDIDDDLARWTTAERAGDARTLAHQHAVGDASGTPVPPDTRVTFTIVTDDDSESTVAGMQYSFIGPPLGGPR